MKEILDMTEEELQQYLINSEAEYEEARMNIEAFYMQEDEREKTNIHSYESVERIRQLCDEDDYMCSLMDDKENLLNSTRIKSALLQENLLEYHNTEKRNHEERIQSIYSQINQRKAEYN
ncbi:MAG: hypothetical protein E7262_07370 [Lachnospiraceae bacterium]|nr:hypothetical protein [Lachnospiraceae bacterium]